MGRLRLMTGAGLSLVLCEIVVVPLFGAGMAPLAGADTTTTLFKFLNAGL